MNKEQKAEKAYSLYTTLIESARQIKATYTQLTDSAETFIEIADVFFNDEDDSVLSMAELRELNKQYEHIQQFCETYDHDMLTEKGSKE